jgi:hypothetical protein
VGMLKPGRRFIIRFVSANPIGTAGRVLLVLPMLVYPVLHFLNPEFVGSIVPPWVCAVPFRCATPEQSMTERDRGIFARGLRHNPRHNAFRPSA